MLKGSWIRKQSRFLLSLLLAICAALSMGAVISGSDPNDVGAPRSRLYKFRHITSAQAKDILSDLKLGSDYNTLTGDVLILTSNSGSDLIKASEVLDLADMKEPSSVKILADASLAESLPDLEAFAAGLKGISVGTMIDGPATSAQKPAIVDIHGGRLVAIAPVNVLAEIEEAFDKWKRQHASASPKPQEAKPEQPKPQQITEQAQPPEQVEQSEQTADAESAISAQPAEPNLSDVAQEALKEIEKTDNIPLPDEAAKIKETQSQITEIAQTEPQSQTEPQPETAQASKEDFLEQGLLDALADAEQKAQQKQEPAALQPEHQMTEIPSVPQQSAQEPDILQQSSEQPQSEQGMSQDEGAKLLEAMLKQAQQEEQALKQEMTQQQAQTEQPQEQAEQQQAQTAAAAQQEPNAPLKSEIDNLREQLARIEQMLAERADAPQTVEVPPKEPVKVEMSPEIAEKEIETTMDLPQEIDLENLVDLVGKQLGLNYMYDKTILQGQKVQLKVYGGKIKVGETYALLESVLRFKGFIMTRRNGIVTILKAQDMPRAEPMLRAPDEPIPAGEVIVSTVFHLNHIDVNNAENMLRGMNLGTNFTKIPETNTIIVTDYSYRMSQIQQVLEMIDVVGELKEYKFRTLQYLKPSELLTKLKDLAGQLQGVSLQIAAPVAAETAMRTIQTRDPRTGRTITQQVPAASPTPAGPGAAPAQPDSVFIDTDDRTNRILIAGKRAQIELVNELIDALDVPQHDLKYVREYIIQYVEAIEVVNVLNGLGLANINVSAPTQQQSQMSSRYAGAGERGVNVPVQPQPQPQAVHSAAQGGQGAGPEQPYVAIRPATNSLLVNATAEQHKAIELVISHVDVIQKDKRTIRQYEIQHVDTQEIMDTLADLGIIAGDQAQTQSQYDQTRGTSSRSPYGSPSSRAMQQQQMQNPEAGIPMNLPTVEGGSQVDITAEQPQIAVLRATNSLLVYATPRQHDAISLVIAHADRVPEVASTPYVVYALENQDPVELAEVLTKLIEETVQEQSQTSSPDSKIQTTTTTTRPVIPTLEEEKIRIIPDEMSYSLIVYANKRNQQWVSELIAELDEYRPQVLLDCTLVEITKDDQFQYSIDLVGKTYDGTTLQTGTPVTRPAGVTAPFSDDTLADASTIGGNITAFLNTGSVQAVLRAMQEKGFGRVMSQPKLLVNDNQEGEIKSETKTSIAQKKTIIQPGSETGQTITSEDVTFNEYSAGVTLKIKPHISKGDMLRLEITLTRADFRLQPDVIVAGDSFPRPPDILSTDVTSVATVPDGTTIVLGGLESVTQNKAQNKVPILGDIPLLGAIFRSVDDTDEQSKLYIFVKAHVIRPGDQVGGLRDIRRVSGKYRDEFEDMERKFQRQDDFPGWKPKPMEPEKVLEEDEEYLEDLEERLQQMDFEKSSAQ